MNIGAAYSSAITIGFLLVSYPRGYNCVVDIVRTYRDAREHCMPDISEADKAEMKAIWKNREHAPSVPELLDSVLHTVWFHGNWRYLTSRMTTEEKEAFADAVERYSARMNAEDRDLDNLDVGRWWRD